MLANPLRGPVPASPARDAGAVREFHCGLPGYAATPLRTAPTTAAALGVGRVLVKDESLRLGTRSFKILGAAWATYRAICARLGLCHVPVIGVPALAERLRVDGTLRQLIAATEGNHGRAVARMARLLGLAAHIVVPTHVTDVRIAAIRSEGAAVVVVEGGYDDAIAESARLADDRSLVISDTSWPGYTEIPGWVIDGYATIGAEIEAQLGDSRMPTVVAAQLGVGAFGAAMVRRFVASARLVAVEPAAADCVIASVEAGEPITIANPTASTMSGLNCGTPSRVAWPVVAAGFHAFTTIEDDDAERAMRLLAGDGVVSGHTGAAGLAGLLAFAGPLGLTDRDTVLVVSTEADP